MSLVTFLSIARSALFAQQRAMNVTAHNVANAQTPGYSRQRLELAAATPEWTPFGTIGRGVDSSGVSRARDQFLDGAFRRQSGLLGRSGTLADALGQIEGAVHEPSDSGVAAALDGLFQSFSDLSNDPSSGTSRGLVRQAAQKLVDRLHQLDTSLRQATSDATERLTAQVKDVNTITARIGELNAQILATGGPAHSAADLQDVRDQLIDQLAGMMDVRVVPHDDGTVGVLAGGALLVDGGGAQTLSVTALVGGGFGVGTAGGTIVDPGSGSMKALSELTTTTLPGMRARLDDLARSLVTEINAVHRTGYTLSGATNADFFDPAGVTAGSIALAPAVLASTDEIAAGGTIGAGDGSIALALAGLRTLSVTGLGGKTFREFYTAFAGSVGTEARSASDDATGQAALVDNADQQRMSVSGVSIDEEMTNLITQQQAYSAAARLVKIADEMMQDIMSMLG